LLALSFEDPFYFDNGVLGDIFAVLDILASVGKLGVRVRASYNRLNYHIGTTITTLEQAGGGDVDYLRYDAVRSSGSFI
jgi:hypothetical protein